MNWKLDPFSASLPDRLLQALDQTSTRRRSASVELTRNATCRSYLWIHLSAFSLEQIKNVEGFLFNNNKWGVSEDLLAAAGEAGEIIFVWSVRTADSGRESTVVGTCWAGAVEQGWAFTVGKHWTGRADQVSDVLKLQLHEILINNDFWHIANTILWTNDMEFMGLWWFITVRMCCFKAPALEIP